MYTRSKRQISVGNLGYSKEVSCRRHFTGRRALAFDDFEPEVELKIGWGLALQLLDEHLCRRSPDFTPWRGHRSDGWNDRPGNFLVVEPHDRQIFRNPNGAAAAFK